MNNIAHLIFKKFFLITSLVWLSTSFNTYAQTTQNITEAEIIYIVLDSSASMSWSAIQGGVVDRTGIGGDRRWDYVIGEAEHYGEAEHGEANRGNRWEHVYVRFIEFNEPGVFVPQDAIYKFYEKTETRGPRGRTRVDIKVRQEVMTAFDKLYKKEPAGFSSAIYQSICTSMVAISNFNKQQLETGLEKSQSYTIEQRQLPANLKITEREVWFYSDLDENASVRCADNDITGNPGHERVSGQVIKSLKKYQAKHVDEEFRLNIFMKLYKNLNGGSDEQSRHGVTLSTKLANEVDDFTHIAESLSGHVHVIIEDAPPKLVGGHQNCYEHGYYVCAD